MRWDEIASQSEIERSQRFGQNIKNVGGAIAGAALTGGAARIAPLLSGFINPEMALKGIEKIAPQIGKSLRKGMESGLSLKEGLNFMRSQLGIGEEKSQEQATKQKEHPNISQIKDLETRYPHVIQALMRSIQGGQPPQAAAAIIKGSSDFSKDVKKIEKESGKNFVDLILELMSSQQQQQEGGQMAPQMQAGQMSPQEMQNPMSQAGGMQQQQAQQPGGNIDQDLIAALQKILQM